MKRICLIAILSLAMVAMPTKKSHAIVWVVVKAAVKKVVKAIDLQIQRQQNKVIWLQNAQKTLENALSKLKLKEIGDWTERQRTLYKDYFEELTKVKNAISSYHRVKEIATTQVQLVDEYKRAWDVIRHDKHFTPEEIKTMYTVYQGMLERSAMHVGELSRVIKSYGTSMSDFGRMAVINQVADRSSQTLDDLRRYNWENRSTSMARASSEQEIRTVELMYGLEGKF